MASRRPPVISSFTKHPMFIHTHQNVYRDMYGAFHAESIWSRLELFLIFFLIDMLQGVIKNTMHRGTSNNSKSWSWEAKKYSIEFFFFFTTKSMLVGENFFKVIFRKFIFILNFDFIVVTKAELHPLSSTGQKICFVTKIVKFTFHPDQ